MIDPRPGTYAPPGWWFVTDWLCGAQACVDPAMIFQTGLRQADGYQRRPKRAVEHLGARAAPDEPAFELANGLGTPGAWWVRQLVAGRLVCRAAVRHHRCQAETRQRWSTAWSSVVELSATVLPPNPNLPSVHPAAAMQPMMLKAGRHKTCGPRRKMACAWSTDCAG
jgi:hypothetical protein